MAAKFQTTMLRAGHTYHSGDRQVPVSKERLQHWQAEHNRLKSAGYTPPMHYDHSDEFQSPITMDSIAKKKGRSAANSIGYLDDFKLNEAGDAAELTYKIIDDKVAKQLDEGVVHLSPIILSKFQDGAKNQYKDVIGHLDVVNYPVDYSQSSASRVAISMGIDTEPGADIVAIRVNSSKSPLMFREDVAIAMGMDTDGSMYGEAENEKGDISRIMKNLEVIGLELHDDTDSQNFIERLDIALTVFVKSNPLYSMDDDEGMMGKGGDTFGNDNGERIVAEHEIATTMSLQTYADTQYRENQKAKLDALLESGRCNPAEHKQQVDSLNSIKLSLTDGKPDATSVSQFLDNRSAVPQGAFWSPERKIKEQGSAADHPAGIKMSANPDEADKEVTDAELDELMAYVS